MDNEQYQPDSEVVKLRTVYRLAWEFANHGAPVSPGTRISVGSMFEEMGKQIAKITDLKSQEDMSDLAKYVRRDAMYRAALTGLLAHGQWKFDDRDAVLQDYPPLAAILASQSMNVLYSPEPKSDVELQREASAQKPIGAVCFVCSTVLRPDDSFCFDCGACQPRL